MECYKQKGMPHDFLDDLNFKKESDRFPDFDQTSQPSDLVSYIFQNKYGNFYHDFFDIKNKTGDEVLNAQLSKVREKYIRRFNRLYEVIKNGCKINFIAIQVTNILSKKCILEFLYFFKNHNIKLLYLHSKTLLNIKNNNFSEINIEKSNDWKYDSIDWSKILNN